MEQNPLAARKPKQAAKILENSLGSNVKNIKRYSAFEGKISHNKIKPSILNAIRKSMMSNPEGARGHFFFWGNQSAQTGSRRKRSAQGRGRRAASLGSKRRRAKTEGTNSKRDGPGCKCKSHSKRKKSKGAKERDGHTRKRLRLSEIMKYSGMRLKNGRRLIVFTTKD